jgi:hypothetical protein
LDPWAQDPGTKRKAKKAMAKNIKNFKELILPTPAGRGGKKHPSLGKDEFFKTKINSLTGQKLANLMPFQKTFGLLARISSPPFPAKVMKTLFLQAIEIPKQADPWPKISRETFF